LLALLGAHHILHVSRIRVKRYKPSHCQVLTLAVRGTNTNTTRYEPLPPLREERHLCPDEGHIPEVLQFLHHVVEDVARLVMIVALVGFDPARIVV